MTEEDWSAGQVKDLLDIHIAYQERLRDADQRAIEIAFTAQEAHFARLNENAARTIEERRHFVSEEVFMPFRDLVMRQLSQETGRRQGIGTLAAVAAFAVGVLVPLTGIAITVIIATH